MDKVHYAALWGRADSTQVRAADAPLREGGKPNTLPPGCGVAGNPSRQELPYRTGAPSATASPIQRGRDALTRAPPVPAGESPAVPGRACSTSPSRSSFMLSILPRGGSRNPERSPDALASEETRPVLRAPSGRDRTGQTKRLLGGNCEAT